MMLTIAIMLLSASSATASPPPPDGNDSTEKGLSILYVGSLNSDCYLDTVLGKPDSRFNYLPRFIRWGTQSPRDSAGVDSLCQSPTPEGRRVKQTTITYPGWGGFSGSAAFQRLNPDTLTDMILYLWGSTGQGNAKRDTMRAVAVFGQRALDSITVLHIADVANLQSDPYVAMELTRGTHLVNPGARDLSRFTSYELMPVDVSVDDQDTNGRPGMPIENYNAMRVYPNPAGISALVEAQEIPAGRYHVEIISVNGEVYQREEIEVEDSRTLFGRLDVQGIPAGWYVVRLERDGRMVGSYPIIVTR